MRTQSNYSRCSKAPKGYMKITPAQLEAIKNVTDDISAMIGGDFEVAKIWRKNVQLVDRFLKSNGQKRDFK